MMNQQPVPQFMQQYPMMPSPKPQLPELSKADLTKILLAMLAKEDLEA